MPDFVQQRDFDLLCQLLIVGERIEQVGEEHHDARGSVGDHVGLASKVLRAFEQAEGARVEALSDQLGARTGLEHHGDALQPLGEGRGELREGLLRDPLDAIHLSAGAEAGPTMRGRVEAQDLEVVADLGLMVARLGEESAEGVVGIGEGGVHRHRARQQLSGAVELPVGPCELPEAREDRGLVRGHRLRFGEIGCGRTESVLVEEVHRLREQVVEDGSIRGIEGGRRHARGREHGPAQPRTQTAIGSGCGPSAPRSPVHSTFERSGPARRDGGGDSEYRPPPVPVRVQIRGFAHGGEGVGQEDDGLTWFVPGALPGETVDVEPERRKARWARGRLVQVVQTGPDRVEPPCGLADRCGGCDWQHVAVARQAEHKRAIVAGQLRGLVDDPASVRLADVPASGSAYRRRVRMHYAKDEQGTLRLGFFAARTRDVVDVPRCPVLRPELDYAVQRIRSLAEHLPRQGELLGLSDGERACIALPGVRPVEAVLEAAHELLDDRLCGVLLRGGRQSTAVGVHELSLDRGEGLVSMHAHPFIFTQANAEVNRAMVRHVAQAARPDGRRVLELYAGAGNLTRALARTARRVWTLDDDREARGLLRAMADAHGLPINAKHGSAPGLLRSLADKGTRYDVVVVDPPRKGLGEGVCEHLASVAEERVVYVSCDPATLARDLRVLVARGFVLRDVRVFDMMPMTAQVEVVATLIRGGGGGVA